MLICQASTTYASAVKCSHEFHYTPTASGKTASQGSRYNVPIVMLYLFAMQINIALVYWVSC